MKKHVLTFVQVGVLVMLGIFTFAQCRPDAQITPNDNNGTFGMTQNRQAGKGGNNAAQTCVCLLNQYAKEALSADETSALLKMREEEKLARDVYQYLYAQWKLPVFQNIAQAEQQHMDAVGCLLQKYALTDPVGQQDAGTFTDPTLQTLYKALVDKGGKSIVEALRVGATIEDLDIDDLLVLTQTKVDNQDVLAVFDQLTRGSRNHMRAFSQQLQQNGATYEPQYISPALYTQILNGAQEKGGGLCNTSGGGRGRRGR